MSLAAASVESRSRRRPPPATVARVLGYALVLGAAGALLPPIPCAAVAGAILAFEAVSFGARRTASATLVLVSVAAALGAPLLATASVRSLTLAVAGLAWVALAWARPAVALGGLIVLAPFHTLVLSLLEGRWLIDGGALGQWKDLGIATLAVRTVLVVVRGVGRADGWRDPRQWAAPLRWGAAMLAWIAATSVRAVVTHSVGLGLALRGLAADLGPFALLAIGWAACRGGLASAPTLRRLTIALAIALVVFGFVQLLLIGPEWYAAVGYTGPRDFKVPGYEHHRLTSVFLDPLPAGLFLALASLLALDEAFLARDRWARARSLAAAVGLALAVLATFTRSAWLGLALGAVVVARAHWGNPDARRWIGIAALVMVVAALPLAPRLASWTRDTLAGAATDTSTPRHFEAWLRGAQALADHPFGLGPGRAGEVSVRMLGANGIVTESSYLQFGVEFGVVGLVLLAGLVMRVGRALLARSAAGEAGAAGVAAGWVALALAAFFLHALTERPVAYPAMILAGMALAQSPLRIGDRAPVPGRAA